jgi:hypothetical protein
MRVVANTTAAAAVLGIALGAATPPAAAQPLSIYEVQYTENDDGSSYYDGAVIDCVGGVCVGKFPGSRPRLILQDPAYADGWGGIQVKDWTAGDLYDQVAIGDWVSLTNMLVEEFRGTTFLQWQTAYNPGFTVVSEGNPLPPYLRVAASDIPAPVYDPNDDGWYVESHDAELYESMRLLVRDVTVTALDLGKAGDNYNLEGARRLPRQTELRAALLVQKNLAIGAERGRPVLRREPQKKLDGRNQRCEESR